MSKRKSQNENYRGEKRFRRCILYSDSDSDESGDEGNQPVIAKITAQIHNAADAPVAATALETADVDLSTSQLVSNTAPAENDESVIDLSAVDQHDTPPAEQLPLAATTAEIEIEIDPELLQALGESTDDTPDYGPKIHASLAKLWLPLLKKGLAKETKEKLIKENLIPDNCRLLQSPKLNAEISAAVPDVVRNRDKALMTQQQQLGSGITAINRGLDVLLKGDDKKHALQHLSNGCRILSDLHANFTQNRIRLLSSNLDKGFLHVIQDTERDETLFSNKLSDKIKAAKAIEKQGLQIKKVTNSKGPSKPTTTTNRSGNWSGPPRYHSNRGGRGGSKRGAPPSHRPYPYPYTSPAPTPAANKAPPANKPRASTSTQ